MANKKEEKQIDKVVDILGNITNKLDNMDKRITDIEQNKQPTATEQFENKTGITPEIDETIQEMKIHPKHRQIVDDVLGKQFYAWESFNETDSTHFMFHISVPLAISSLSKEDIKKGRVDTRSRAISNAEGENGVKQWCLLVRKNLNQYYQNNALPSPFTHNVTTTEIL